uniref:potassium channel subfamily K member 1-like n=1 Tax=Heptranchias perlo TaxID=212740 RepID=UPI00355964E4
MGRTAALYDSMITSYGHTVPLTNGGKAFCILYSVLGIPVTLLMLTSLVQRLMFYVHWVPIVYVHANWGLPLKLVAQVHAFLVGLVVVSCFFLIPAAAFVALEKGWDYVQSLYFCFISLSTIGLGDYVPGKSRYPSYQHLYKAGIACYMMIGLVALLVVVETFYKLEEMQHFVQLFVSHVDKEVWLGLREQEVAITASKAAAVGGLACGDRRVNGPETALHGEGAVRSSEQ